MDTTSKILADAKAWIAKLQQEIAKLQKVVDALESDAGSSDVITMPEKKKRKHMSQATKDKIAAGRKKAWDEKHAEEAAKKEAAKSA